MLNDVHSICGYLISKYLYENKFSNTLAFEEMSALPYKGDSWFALANWVRKFAHYFENLTFENKYILTGVVLANFPDIDTLLTPIYGYTSVHRTLTHSIAGNAVIIPVCAYLVQKILKLQGLSGFLHACLFVSACIGSHLVTDYITNYGTSIYFPFNKKPVSMGVITVLDFTTVLYFYTSYFVSRSGYVAQSKVLGYSVLGFALLMLWKRAMLLDVYDKSFYLIQNLKKKYKNTTIWLQPSNIFNGQYSILKKDDKSKTITQIRVVYASQVVSLINYIMDLFGLRKIDVRKVHSKHEAMEIDTCAPRGYMFELYRDNKTLFSYFAKHTIPSAIVGLNLLISS